MSNNQIKWKVKNSTTVSDSRFWKALSGSRNMSLLVHRPYSKDDMKPGGRASTDLAACFESNSDLSSFFPSLSADSGKKVKSLAFDFNRSQLVGLNSNHSLHDVLLKLTFTPMENLDPDAVNVQMSQSNASVFLLPKDNNFALVTPLIHFWMGAHKIFGHGHRPTAPNPTPVNHSFALKKGHANFKNYFSEAAQPYEDYAHAEGGFPNKDPHGFSPVGWYHFFKEDVVGDDQLAQHFSALAKTPPSVIFGNACVVELEKKRCSVPLVRDNWLHNQWFAARMAYGDQFWVPTGIALDTVSGNAGLYLEDSSAMDTSGNQVTNSIATADQSGLDDDTTVPSFVQTESNSDEAGVTANIPEKIQAWCSQEFQDSDARVSTAVSLWADIIASFTQPIALYKELVEFGQKQPVVFAKFLREVTPEARELLKGLEDDQLGSSKVTRAFSTAVYAKIQDPLNQASTAYYEAAGMGKPTGRQVYKNAETLLKLLCGTIHFLLHSYPERYPCFIRAIKHLNEFGDDYKIPSPQFFGDGSFGFPFKMPFLSWKCFLRVFGITPRGHVCESDRVTSQISMDSVLKHMPKVETVFAGQSDDYKITMDDANHICKELLGLNPVIWKLAEKKNPSDYYSLVTAGIDMKAKDEVTVNEFNSLLRKYVDDVLEPEFDVGQYSDEEAPDGEVPISDLCQNMSAIVGLRGKKPSKKATSKKSTMRYFPPDPKMACVYEAAASIVEKWNRDGRPLDIQLDSGLAIHDEFGKAETRDADVSSFPTMTAKLVKLGAGDAPCVIGFTNGLSPEFLQINAKQTDATAFALDSHGDGNTSCVGSFFYCEVCNSGDEASVEFMGPHMKLGRRNSILSKQADAYQRLKNVFAAEIMNSFLDASNALLRKVADITDPPGASKQKGQDKVVADEQMADDPPAPADQVHIDVVLSSVELQKKATKVKRNRYDKALLSGVQYFPRQIPNENIIKVGPHATYSDHQDAQSTLNSDISCLRDCAANDDILPIQQDFPVCTLISGTGSVPVRVQWNRQGKVLGSIDTDVGTIHVQLPGANYHNIKHGSFEISEEKSTLCPEENVPDEGGASEMETTAPAEEGDKGRSFSLSIDPASLCGENRESKIALVTPETKLQDLSSLAEDAYACCRHPLDGSWNCDLPDGEYKFAGFSYYKSSVFEDMNDNENGGLNGIPFAPKPLPLASTMAQLGLLEEESDDDDNHNMDDDSVPRLWVYLTFSDENGDLFHYKMGTASPMFKKANDNRIIETFRMVSCPHCNPWSYVSGVRDDGLLGPNPVSKHPFCKYDRVSILTNYTILENVQPTLNSDGTHDAERAKKYQKLKPTLLRAVPPRKFDNLGEEALNSYIDGVTDGVTSIVRPRATVALNDKRRQKSVNHYSVVKHALSKGVVFEVVDTSGELIKDQPLFMLDGKLLQPGTKLPLRKLPFKVTRNSMTVVHPDYSNVFLIVHAYKNDPRTFKLAHEVATMWQQLDLKVQENKARFIATLSELEKMGLVMNGFGGSAQKSDLHIAGARGVRLDDATFKIGDYQSSRNKETQLFMKAFDAKRPVAIFLVESKFAPEEKNFHKYDWQSTKETPNMSNSDEQDTEMEEAETTEVAGGPLAGNEEDSDDEDYIDSETDLDEASSVVEESHPPSEPTNVDADVPKDTMTFLGYYRPEHHFTKDFTHAFVDEQFKGMDKYRNAESFNITHLIYQAYRFVMRPLFSADELFHQWSTKDNPPLYTRVQIWDQDSRPFSVPYEDLVVFLHENYPQHEFFQKQDPQKLREDPFLGVPRLKIEHIQNYYFKKLLLEPDDFKEVFESKRDPNTGFVDKEAMRFLFAPRQVLSILPYVNASASYRQQRRHVVFTDMDGNRVEEGHQTVRKMYCTPLVQAQSDLLPDPLRLSPLPQPNQDFDVNAQAVAHNNRTLLEKTFPNLVHGETDDQMGDNLPKVVQRSQEEGSQPLSYRDLDLSVEGNCLLLTNMLLAAVVMRFTGKVDHLRQWDNPDYRGQGIFLPTLGTMDDFVHYLETHLLINNPNAAKTGKPKSCRKSGRKNLKNKPKKPQSTEPRFYNYTHLQSGQHQKTIPDFPSREKFLAFLRVLGSDTSNFGFRKVKEYIVNAGKDGNTLERKPLTELMINVISQCGDLQGNDKLKFMVNKAILDVRSVLVNFVTKMTADLIHLGWGSQQGLDCIQLSRSGTAIARFQFFHHEFYSLLMNKSDEYLHSIGYKKIHLGMVDGEQMDPYIGSLFSGRPYEMCDTEHILCKIWLCVIHSHQSRNLSKAKQMHNNHTWPLPEVLPWEVHLSPFMLFMWKHFCKIRSEHEYPKKLHFYFGEEEDKGTSKKGGGKKSHGEPVPEPALGGELTENLEEDEERAQESTEVEE